MEYEEAINNQYGKSNLGTLILATLQSKGIDTAKKIQDVLAPIEELHLRGRRATLELAHEIGLNENMKVLDIGCGIGGSARTLFSNFRCNVTGIDLCEEFCRAADLINERLGYSNNIEIQQGDALDMPFNDNSYTHIIPKFLLLANLFGDYSYFLNILDNLTYITLLSFFQPLAEILLPL